MNLISIPAFQDNYIWVLSENNGRCIIVDPGRSRAGSGGHQGKPVAARGYFIDPSSSGSRRRRKTIT